MQKQKWPLRGFRYVVGLMFLFLSIMPARAQEKQKTKAEEAVYVEVVRQRADKLVGTLEITNASKATRVRDIIARQYLDLHAIQAKRDAQTNAAKKKAGDNKESADARVEAIKRKAATKTQKLHAGYLSRLSAELTAQQVDQVKDGMTYHVVPSTYRNYLLMLPYLTKEQRDTIKSFLVEAREHAMDGGSSKEKHAWFGKYKGRITNYLAAQGIDLKKEGINWAERRNTHSNAVEITQSKHVVGKLGLTDDIQKEHVRNLIAHRYQSIQEAQAERDAKMKATDQLPKIKEERDQEAAAIWAQYQVRLGEQRDSFIEALSAFLDSSHVETLQNEMTDNRLQEEYSHFLALLPDLNDSQKKQVYAYLLEARGNAINVLDKESRLKWFIKFRGRTNNYLSREGYNLRKATEDLERKLLVEKKEKQ
ncbi:DUF3826 domain-containing protein [Rufibacter tibetensis]|uniref:DUF3826 domain-containing protein n=1 Tax=Rufibacter tibetensis TaxID=512763 RepID=UPI0007826CC8|nr:DUF3826 domain-containing protein [Rufibacter tibetensis]